MWGRHEHAGAPRARLPRARRRPGRSRTSRASCGSGSRSSTGTGEFDAAIAIRSLHHVHDLEAGVDALADALRPEARLVVFEFAIEAVDGAALRWCDDNGLRRPPRPESTPDVTPLAAVRIALERRFRPLDETPTPYHALEAGRPDLEPAERREIAAGRLLPAGSRLAYERRA